MALCGTRQFGAIGAELIWRAAVGHREFMDYLGRVERDMDILRARHSGPDYGRARRAAEESESRRLKRDLEYTRERIVARIRRCAELPAVKADDVCFLLAHQPFDTSLAPCHIQDLALDVSRASGHSDSAEIQQIKESLYDLAERVGKLR